MFNNPLFFEDFEKIFKVKIAEEKTKENKAKRVEYTHNLINFSFRRILIKLRLQYILH